LPAPILLISRQARRGVKTTKYVVALELEINITLLIMQKLPQMIRGDVERGDISTEGNFFLIGVL